MAARSANVNVRVEPDIKEQAEPLMFLAGMKNALESLPFGNPLVDEKGLGE